MYALLDRRSRQENPRISFLADYRRANRAAGTEKITIGPSGRCSAAATCVSR